MPHLNLIRQAGKVAPPTLVQGWRRSQHEQHYKRGGKGGNPPEVAATPYNTSPSLSANGQSPYNKTNDYKERKNRIFGSGHSAHVSKHPSKQFWHGRFPLVTDDVSGGCGYSPARFAYTAEGSTISLPRLSSRWVG